MTLFVCVDKKMGIAFNHRRQSQDTEVLDRIVKMTRGETLYVSPYTAPLFEGRDCHIEVLDDPQDAVRQNKDGACFLELAPVTSKPGRIVIFGWGVEYPQDTKCGIPFNDYDIAALDQFHGAVHDSVSVTTLIRKGRGKKNSPSCNTG